MAKFIEYKSDPSWTTLFSWCWGAVIPLLTIVLFIQGVVSWIGLVVIVACLIGVLFFLNEQVERRSGIVTEVASGKLPKGPSKTVDHTVLEFREDPFGPTTLGIIGADRRHYLQDEGGLGCGWPRSCCVCNPPPLSSP